MDRLTRQAHRDFKTPGWTLAVWMVGTDDGERQFPHSKSIIASGKLTPYLSH